jgi:FlaA1/EpsC-like NDP-sugar epimerase
MQLDGESFMPARLLEYRRFFIVALQAGLIVFAYLASFLLRLDLPFPVGTGRVILETVFIVLAVKLVVFTHFGLYSGWWRYAGLSDLLEISKAGVVSTAVLAIVFTWVLRPAMFPRSVYIIDLCLTVTLIAGVRVLVRLYTESVKSYSNEKRTLIAGAGSAGTELARQLQHNPDLGYRPIGLVDDDPSKKGIRIHGLTVLANMDKIPTVIRMHDVQCVVIAIPSATGQVVEKIMRHCRDAKVEFKVLQPIGSLINGHTSTATLSRFRDLRLEDLLRRAPVRLDAEEIRKRICDKVVLVTGAGGSIGSELCRQVARFKPHKLVLFERAESDLFRICTELSHSFPELNAVPVIGDIQDLRVLRDTFALHRPHSVYHAAAYKHVPMMEMNCFQAITNNVFGTWNVAQVARQFEVEDFVLISSDKAVNPSNVMGVTKRIAELMVLGIPPLKTKFLAVRFGNVLGSNGSVVPLFQEQIARGGPVLVTHPDAKRYFMTIPEATQLVLQAASMNQGGEIVMMEMGEQVRIADLATDLIHMAGLEPDRDIKIVWTGLRPGEKVSEELHLQREGITPTAHEKLYVIDPGPLDYAKLRKWVAELSRAVEAKNVHLLVETLKRMVPEYTPSAELLALCELDQLDMSLRFDHAGSWTTSFGPN